MEEQARLSGYSITRSETFIGGKNIADEEKKLTECILRLNLEPAQRKELIDAISRYRKICEQNTVMNCVEKLTMMLLP